MRLIMKILKFLFAKSNNNHDCSLCEMADSNGEYCWECCNDGDKFKLDKSKAQKYF